MPNITVSATRTVKGATKQQWQALIGRDEREGRGCRGGVWVIEREGAVREAASLRVREGVKRGRLGYWDWKLRVNKGRLRHREGVERRRLGH